MTGFLYNRWDTDWAKGGVTVCWQESNCLGMMDWVTEWAVVGVSQHASLPDSQVMVVSKRWKLVSHRRESCFPLVDSA